MRSTTAMAGKKKKGSKDNLAEIAFAALDDVGTHILICDRDLNITYANKASIKTLASVEAEIQKALPAFSVDRIVGSNIDSYHKFPERQRGILADSTNMPHKADIQIGPLTLELKVNAIMKEGEYVGNIVEWEEVSEKRQLERERKMFVTALESAGTNIMIADEEDNIVFANKSSIDTLRKVESDLRKVLPGFDVSKIIGSSIHKNHRDPDQIRRILSQIGPGDTRQAEIKPGNLIFDLRTRGIFDDKGEKIAHMVEWGNITGEKKAQAEVERMIKAASEGRLAERIDLSSFEGFYLTLAEGINQVLEAVMVPLDEAQLCLGSLAEGDLKTEMSGEYQGSFDKIKQSLNSAIQKLAQTLSLVQSSADSVLGGVTEISHGNDDLSQRTSEQASALEQTSSSMEEMTSTVKQNADNAKQANQLAVAARDVAQKGGEVTNRTIEAMTEVNKSSKKIVDIISVIDEIAFQTNLLALNAAVEAARAGEHGRGFAVVAAEVRNLAQRSATAAKEIKSLINESVQQVTDSSSLVNQSGKTLEEIVESVKRVTDVIGEISAASQEQSAGIDQINKAIMQMDETTQQNAALVEEATSTSHNIKGQTDDLINQVAFFKFDAVETPQQPEQETGSGGPRTVKPVPRAYAPAKPRPAARQPVAAGHRNGNGNGNGKSLRAEPDDFEEF